MSDLDNKVSVCVFADIVQTFAACAPERRRTVEWPGAVSFWLESNLEVMRTTRQHWWQRWKPRPNACERAVIAAFEAQPRPICIYTGPMKKEDVEDDVASGL